MTHITPANLEHGIGNLPLPRIALTRVPVAPLGMALAAFLMISYTLCVLLVFIAPGQGLHQAWLQFLPGFEWTWTGYFIGLAENFVYGWYVALVFAPLYNWFAEKWAS
jgi:hypothetical protein